MVSGASPAIILRDFSGQLQGRQSHRTSYTFGDEAPAGLTKECFYLPASSRKAPPQAYSLMPRLKLSIFLWACTCHNLTSYVIFDICQAYSYVNFCEHMFIILSSYWHITRNAPIAILKCYLKSSDYSPCLISSLNGHSNNSFFKEIDYKAVYSFPNVRDKFLQAWDFLFYRDNPIIVIYFIIGNQNAFAQQIFSIPSN